MNGILTLTHNCFDLTRKAIWSFATQDVDVIQAIDNGSTDGTRDWLEGNGWLLHANPTNAGVSSEWNRGLKWFFGHGADSVLVIGNDTWIPPYFFGELLSYNLPFVTGVAVDNMEQIQPVPTKCPLDPHPDFSAFLISRQCWQTVGRFDERMKLYASDCDWHIRAHRLGIPLWKASCEFYHERSSTMKYAPEAERAELVAQANKDRAEFYLQHGCLPGTPEYEAIFAGIQGAQTGPAAGSSGNNQQIRILPANDIPSTVWEELRSYDDAMNLASGVPALEPSDPEKKS